MRRLASILIASSLVMLAACAPQERTQTASVGPNVRVDVYDGEKKKGFGSGVYIGGIILTAAHVVEAGNSQIVLPQGAAYGQRAKAGWIGGDIDAAAILPMASDGLLAANISCADPVVGEPIHIVGNPSDLPFVRTTGYVATEPSDYRFGRYFLADATTIKGMSGAAVYDSKNRVIGIVSRSFMSQFEASGTLMYVVPMSDICKILGRS